MLPVLEEVVRQAIMVTQIRQAPPSPMPDDLLWVAIISDLVMLIKHVDHPKYDRAVGHLNAARAAVQELIDGY